MITKFIGKAPIDTLWVSDSWLPEWAEAGWIVPVDQYKSLTATIPTSTSSASTR